MSYPRQDVVLERLEKETTIYLDRLEAERLYVLKTLWEKAKQSLKAKIFLSYRTHNKGKDWVSSDPAQIASIALINHAINGVLSEVSHRLKNRGQYGLRVMNAWSIARHAWMLDMLTPPSRRVKIPKRPDFHEAAGRSIRFSEQSVNQFNERIDTWTKSYAQALQANIQMGALNDSSVDDVVDEVDATKIGTPQADISDALERAFQTESIEAIAQGAADVADANDPLVEEEIWQTRFDADVCEICEPNRGMTPENADDDIPAHPNCRCFWRVVPKSYADLLQSGTPEDLELAQELEARNLLPTYMIQRDEQGEIVGRTIVNFDSWVANNVPGMAITAK